MTSQHQKEREIYFWFKVAINTIKKYRIIRIKRGLAKAIYGRANYFRGDQSLNWAKITREKSESSVDTRTPYDTME